MTTNGTDLGDREVAEMIRQLWPFGHSRASDGELVQGNPDAAKVIRAAFARGAAAVRAQAPSLLEAKREGWDAARDWFHPDMLGQWTERFDAERDRRFPLPSPAGITLSNGDVVRYERGGLMRGFHRTGSITVGCNTDPAFYLLNDSDTIGDQKALKAYAAEQSEAR